MTDRKTNQAERRRSGRTVPNRAIRVRRAIPVVPLSDAMVLNISSGGVAIQTRVPLKVGDRLSFCTDQSTPPILAEVLGVEAADNGLFFVRCRCLLGGFDAD